MTGNTLESGRTDEQTPEDGVAVSAASSLDPETLAAEDAVETEQLQYTHESEEHCEHEAAGRVVVGLTDDDGRVLAMVNESGAHAMLPNTLVESDDEWTSAVRAAAADRSGVEADPERIVAVRRVDHLREGASEPFETTHHLLVSASPTADADPECPDERWTADWLNSLPNGVEDTDTDTVADVRRFLH